MKVTIVTPNYNGADTIERTIRSVRNQRHDDIEHIVVDDGSTDRSREIIRRHSDHVRLIEKPNEGQPTAVNVGFREATGRLVSWLNSDDLLLPGAVQAAVQRFDKEPTASMLYGDYAVIDEQDRVIAARQQPSFDYNICLYGYLTVSNAAVFFNRSSLQRCGGCDPALPRACDMDLYLRVARLGPVIHIKQFMGAYRKRARSIHIAQADLLDRETWKVRERHSGLCARDLVVSHRQFRARAFLRMLVEGALWCRLYPFRRYHVSLTSKLVSAALQPEPELT